MRSSTWRLVFRLGGLVALATFAAAVVLGRLYGPSPELRRLGPVRLIAVSKDYLINHNRQARFIDLANGAQITLPMPEGEVLERASFAPWRDARGRTQAVGRWVPHRGSGTTQVSQGVGLARVRYPDGVVLDRIATRILPSGVPCWLPGTRARVLFAAGDGRLYRFFFEGPSHPSDRFEDNGRDDRPRPLSWRVADYDPRDLYFVDLTRPGDEHLAASGLVLASVRERSEDPEMVGFLPAQLWWLRLDRTGTAVIAVGPLTRPGSQSGVEAVCRYPTLVTTAGSGLALAYLGRGDEEMGWRLRVATVEIDPITQAPRPLTEPGQVLAEHCSPSPLGISPDGRWIYGLQRIETPQPQQVVARFPVGPEVGGPREVGLAAASPREPAPRPSHH